MARWSDQVEDLLYEGESVQRSVDVGTTTVVVTSHRVIAFTPGGSGPNFQQVDRPNVNGVGVRTAGDTTFLRWAVQAIGLGFVLIIAGVAVPFDSLIPGGALPTSGAGAIGVGGMLDLFKQVVGLLRNLGDVLVIFGVLLFLFAVVPIGVFLWSRERVLVIGVAGEDDIVVPVPNAVEQEVAAELEGEILPEGVAGEVEDGLLASLLS